MKNLIVLSLLILFINVVFSDEKLTDKESFFLQLQAENFAYKNDELLNNESEKKDKNMFIPFGLGYKQNHDYFSHSLSAYYGLFNSQDKKLKYQCGIIAPELRIHTYFSSSPRQYISIRPLYIFGEQQGILLNGQVGLLWFDLGSINYSSSNQNKTNSISFELEALTFGSSYGTINKYNTSAFNVKILSLSISFSTNLKKDKKISPKPIIVQPPQPVKIGEPKITESPAIISKPEVKVSPEPKTELAPKAKPKLKPKVKPKSKTPTAVKPKVKPVKQPEIIKNSDEVTDEKNTVEEIVEKKAEPQKFVVSDTNKTNPVPVITPTKWKTFIAFEITTFPEINVNDTTTYKEKDSLFWIFSFGKTKYDDDVMMNIGLSLGYYINYRPNHQEKKSFEPLIGLNYEIRIFSSSSDGWKPFISVGFPFAISYNRFIAMSEIGLGILSFKASEDFFMEFFTFGASIGYMKAFGTADDDFKHKTTISPAYISFLKFMFSF